jgi:hypothetical protein
VVRINGTTTDVDKTVASTTSGQCSRFGQAKQGWPTLGLPKIEAAPPPLKPRFWRERGCSHVRDLARLTSWIIPSPWGLARFQQSGRSISLHSVVATAVVT